MSKVSFKEMKNGTKDDYLLLDKHEKKFVKNTAERILNFMSTLTKTLLSLICELWIATTKVLFGKETTGQSW